MDGSPSPGYFAVSDMFAAREWLPAGNVDNQVSTAFAVLLFLVWSATCFARRRNSAFLKARMWQLVLLQTFALYMNMAVSVRKELVAFWFCSAEAPAPGLEGAMAAISSQLRLPWETVLSVDECTSEAGLYTTHGDSWTTYRPPETAKTLSLKSSQWQAPLSCASRVITPELSLANSSVAHAIGQFRPFSALFLRTRNEDEAARLTEAAVQIRTADENGVTALRFDHQPTQTTSSTRFALFADNPMQATAGLVDGVFYRPTWFHCASRQGLDVRRAEQDCRVDIVMSTACAGLIFSVILMRMMRLADLAEIQGSASEEWTSRADAERTRVLRKRSGGSLWMQLRRFLHLQIGPFILNMTFLGTSYLRGSSPCDAGELATWFSFAVVLWFLPSIISKGVMRISSFRESLGMRTEVLALSAVSTVSVFAPSAARQLLFEFAVGVAFVRALLCAMGIFASAALPSHWAAVEVWQRRGRWGDGRQHRGRGSGRRGAGRCVWQAAATVTIHVLAFLDNCFSPFVLLFGCSVSLLRCCFSAGSRAASARGGKAPSVEFDLGTDSVAHAGARLSPSNRPPHTAADGGDSSLWGRIATGGAAAGSPTPGSVNQGAASQALLLESVLRHPSARTHLLQHLRQEFCVETALFVLDVWRLNDDVEVHDDDVPEAAARIWTTYIRAGSERWVNLSSMAVSRVSRELQALNEAGLALAGTPGYVSGTSDDDDVVMPVIRSSLPERQASRALSSSSSSRPAAHPTWLQPRSAASLQPGAGAHRGKEATSTHVAAAKWQAQPCPPRGPVSPKLRPAIELGLIERARHAFDQASKLTLRTLRVDNFARFQRTDAFVKAQAALQIAADTVVSYESHSSGDGGIDMERYSAH